MVDTIKAISLFSGMGGDSLGITNAGCDLIAYSEIMKIFQETHNLNYDSELIGDGNITKTSDEELSKYNGLVNLIFAGFPCQGFSQAGKKLPDDPRNTLFREFLRATRLINPDYIIGENVKGLVNRVTSDGKKYMDVIQGEFESIGYDITHKVMKANLYGVSQKRERLIIVGIKKSLNKSYIFPEPIEGVDVGLRNIVEFDMEGTIKIEKDDYDMTTIPKECILTNMENEEDENGPHPNLKLLAKDKDFVYKDITYPRRLSFGKRASGVHGEIIDIRNPCKTIICSYGRVPRLFVPLQNKKGYYLRMLLPYELKQIQGFPKDYKMSGNKTQQITQIGNAVPPPLIQIIINKLLEI